VSSVPSLSLRAGYPSSDLRILNPPDMHRMALLVVLLSLSACSVDRETDAVIADPDAVPSTVPGATGPVTAPAAPDADGEGMYIARGVCPFECCVYREWTLETPATAHTAPASGAAQAFTLPAGATVRADSGNVYVTRPGIVVADRPFPVAETPGAPTVAAGDSLYLLDSMGEGFFHTRYQGRIYETSGAAWFGGGPPGSTTSGRLVRGAESEWWAHVTLTDGRAGWILMDDIRVDGADACG
jgi:hypothetical protein